jgi:hypothetical protein
MISVLLLGHSAASGRPPTSSDAVRSLSALVSGAVDGVIRDVQLLATAVAPDLAEVAEHAGCSYLAADLAQAVPRAAAAARSPVVLLLRSGASFDRALTDEMSDVVTRHDDWLPGGIALKTADDGALGRLMPRLARSVGVLTTRDRLRGLAPATDAALWRALRPRRIFKIRAWTG